MVHSNEVGTACADWMFVMGDGTVVGTRTAQRKRPGAVGGRILRVVVLIVRGRVRMVRRTCCCTCVAVSYNRYQTYGPLISVQRGISSMRLQVAKRHWCSAKRQTPDTVRDTVPAYHGIRGPLPTPLVQ